MPHFTEEEYKKMQEEVEQRWVEEQARQVRKYGFVSKSEESFKKEYKEYLEKLSKE